MVRSTGSDDSKLIKDWLCVIGISIGAFLVAIDATATSTALPQIRAQVGIDIIDASWVTTAYLSSEAVGILVTAVLVRRFGHESVALASILLFTASSILAGIASDLPTMIAARLGQGASGGTLAPIALAAVKHRLDARHVSAGVTLYTLIVVLGPAIGPSFGGYVAQETNWRWIFFLNVPIGIVAALLILFSGSSSWKQRQASQAFDWIGMAGFAALLCPVIVLVEEYQSIEGGILPSYIKPLMIQIVLSGIILVFLSQTNRSIDKLLNLKLVFKLDFFVNLWILSICMSYVFSSLFYFPLILQEHLGYSATQVGNFMLISGVSMAGAIPVQIVLGKWFGDLAQMLMGLAMLAASSWSMSLIDLNTNTNIIVLSQILRGAGQIFVILQINKFMTKRFNESDLIEATSIFNITFSLSGAIGISISKTFVDRENFVIYHNMIEQSRSSGEINPSVATQVLSRAEMISFSNLFLLLVFLIMFSAVLAWSIAASARWR